MQAFGYHLEHRLFRLQSELASGAWRHGPYQRMTVCDPKPRVIHKAAVRDRVVHHAVVRVIEPIFDRPFLYDSWSCRAGKGTTLAVARCRELLRRLSRNATEPVWILQCDIRKYFASVDHDILLQQIERRMHDEQLLAIIRDIIKSFSPGLPLGNLTSQLFANIYLDPLDHWAKEVLRAPVYLRYCDDFLLAHRDRGWLAERIPAIASFVQERLKLVLHPNKIRLRPWHWGIDWLGYVLYPDHTLLRPKTKRRMRRRVRETAEAYLNGDIGYDTLRAVAASYDGRLAGIHEQELRKYFITLLQSIV